MNLRVQKILRNILFMLALPLMVSAFVFAQNSSYADLCTGVDIQIEHTECSFVTEENIQHLVERQSILPQVTPLRKIDLALLEEDLLENHWIRSANAFIGADHALHIRVEQKQPVIRLVEKDSSDYAYFLDAYANPIPLSDQYSPRLPVASVSSLGFSRKDLALKSDLVTLANFLSRDSFWNAAIAQIDVDDKGRLLLIPVLGAQTIILGDITDLDDKFSRLLAFYRKGIQTLDWSKYDEIDVRFAGQVVCRNLRGQALTADPYDKALLVKKKPAAVKAPMPGVQAVAKPTASAKPTPKPAVKTPKKKETSLKDKKNSKPQLPNP